MVRCANGHDNPEGQHFCGECGVALPLICPNRHENPPHQHFCGECGAVLGQSGQTHETPQASESGTQTDSQERIWATHGLKEAAEQEAAKAEQEVSEAEGALTVETTSQAEYHEMRPPTTQAPDRQDPRGASGGEDANGPMKVGDQVRVVNRKDRYLGFRGIVREITNADQGANVKVAFKDGTYRLKFLPDESFAYRPDELEVSGAAVPARDTSGGHDVGGRLKVRDEVRVVNHKDKYFGFRGIVREITNADDGANVKVAFKDGSYRLKFLPDESFAYRPDELKVVGAAEQDVVGNTSGGHDAPGLLHMGDRVQVVARDDKCDGKVGVIEKISDEDHGYNVHVAFQDGSSRRCRRDALKLVGGAGAPLGESDQTRQAPHGKSRQGQSDVLPEAHPQPNTPPRPL